MSTIFCTANFIQKIVEMKDAGQASKIKNLIIIGDCEVDTQSAEAHGLSISTFEAVIKAGKEN